MTDQYKHLALQLIEEFVMLLSPSGHIVWMNQAALSLYGWKESEVIDESLSDLCAKAQLPSPLPKTLAFPYPDDILMEDIETDLDKLKKTILWKLAAYNMENKGTGLLFIGKDITERRQAEDKLFELDSIIAQAPGNIYWFNKNNIYLGCNEQSANILGVSRQEAVGQDFRELMSKLKTIDHELVETLVSQGQEVLKTEKPLTNIEEPPSECADGFLRYYLASKVPLRDRHGNVYGVIGISTDITERKKLEEKWLHEKQKAEAASHAKSDFIANMGHDIRTPITGMLAMNQKTLALLNEANLSLDQPHIDAVALLRHVIETIEKDSELLMGATKELLTLCNAILETARLEAGKTSPQTEIFDVESILKHTVTLLQPVASDKQLELSYTLDPSIPHYLKGIRLYFDRILLNLTSNALKFTDKGFVKITLKLASKALAPFKPGDSLVLNLLIEDSGIGIPEDKKEAIFEHFSRLTASYDGVYQGSGLGLYSVKRYTETMKGQIKVDSTLGKGSCFTLTLPFVCVDEENLPLKSDATNALALPKMNNNMVKGKNSHATRSQPLQAACAEANSKTVVVLIAEDNKLAALGLQQALKPFDCAIDVAENGTQAVEMAKNRQYDLILMDLGLPGLSGVEATKQIRALSDTKHAQVPIIALTGHGGDPKYEQSCLDAGMQAVLSKPTDTRALQPVFQAYVFDDADTIKMKQALLNQQDTKQKDVIDWAACVLLCQGDEELAQESLSTLAEDLQTTASLLSQAYKAQDATALQAELHRTLGGVCYVKIPALNRKLKAFQQAVEENFDDKNQLEVTYFALKNAIGHFWKTWDIMTIRLIA